MSTTWKRHTVLSVCWAVPGVVLFGFAAGVLAAYLFSKPTNR